jgi:hypothetical protein
VRRGLVAVILAAGLSGSITAPAVAQSPSTGPFYGNVEAGLGYFSMPDFGYGTATGTAGAPAYTIKRPDGTLYGGSLTFGYRLPAGAAPSWAGRNARIELSPSLWRGDAVGHVSGGLPSTAGTVSVDGTTSANLNPNTVAKVTVNYSAVDTTLRFVSDYMLGAAITLSPSLELSGGRVDQGYHAAEFTPDGTGALYEDRIREDVGQWRLGIGPGLTANMPLWESYTLTLGGSIGLLAAWSHLDAEDCTDNLGTTPGCDGGFSATKLLGDRTFTSWQGRALVGISRPLLGGRIGLVGEYRNQFAPRVDNPTALGRPAKLVGDRAVSAVGRIVYVIPFE